MPHKKKKAFIPKEEPSATPLDEPADMGHSESHTEKRGRLVVRNLPFKGLTELKLEEFFKEYGRIVEVQLLRLPNGLLKGCGFVEFEKRQSAAKAMYHTNGKLMLGRPIVVDWAVPLHTFVKRLKEQGHEKSKKDLKGEDSDELLEFTIDTKPDPLPGDEEEDVKDILKPEVDVDDDSEEDNKDNDDDDDDDDDDEFDGASNDDDDDDEKPQIKKTVPSDVQEGSTVFVKNVPFDAKNEDVKQCFQVYGDVVYALVCVDKLTEHSKGTAFVKFKEKESADKCLKDSKNTMLMEQPLEVVRAVSKDQLEAEKKKKKTKVRDSRNLYLVREGIVMAGSPAAANLSAADMAKRLQLEQWKSQILRNLNMFISRTRLVVHNLPTNYDDAKLRQLFEQYSGPKAVIKEARVMRNNKKLDSQGQGLSKELGFVTFVNHEDALNALRKINNNPNIFTPSRRPIVGFSIENREILNLKQKRLEKSRAKIMGPVKNVKEKGLDKLNRKQRRFLRRKEKLIAKRQEAKKLKRESGEGSIQPAGKKSNASQNEKSELKSTIGKKNKNKEQKSPVQLQKKSGLTTLGSKKSKTKEPKSPLELQNTSSNNLKPSKKKRNKESVAQSEPSFPKSRKRKNKGVENQAKRLKTDEIADDYGGVAAEPGKVPKMRSKLKLRKQAEIYKERQKERKKLRKRARKQAMLEKQKFKIREPGVKMKKKVNLADDKFNKLISQYKNKIQNSESFKKWYDA